MVDPKIDNLLEKQRQEYVQAALEARRQEHEQRRREREQRREEQELRERWQQLYEKCEDELIMRLMIMHDNYPIMSELLKNVDMKKIEEEFVKRLFENGIPLIALLNKSYEQLVTFNLVTLTQNSIDDEVGRQLFEENDASEDIVSMNLDGIMRDMIDLSVKNDSEQYNLDHILDIIKKANNDVMQEFVQQRNSHPSEKIQDKIESLEDFMSCFGQFDSNIQNYEESGNETNVDRMKDSMYLALANIPIEVVIKIVEKYISLPIFEEKNCGPIIQENIEALVQYIYIFKRVIDNCLCEDILDFAEKFILRIQEHLQCSPFRQNRV